MNGSSFYDLNCLTDITTSNNETDAVHIENGGGVTFITGNDLHHSRYGIYNNDSYYTKIVANVLDYNYNDPILIRNGQLCD